MRMIALDYGINSSQSFILCHLYLSFCFSLPPSLPLPLPHTIIYNNYMDTPLEWHTPNIELIMYVR